MSDHITAALVSVVQEMIDNGSEAPFHVVAIGSNGNYLVATWRPKDGALEPELLGEGGADPRGYAFPVNIMIVDSAGNAGRLAIDGSGKRSKLH